MAKFKIVTEHAVCPPIVYEQRIFLVEADSIADAEVELTNTLPTAHIVSVEELNA